MSGESYDYYLRFLKLARTASEQDIRGTLTNELRVWTRRVNAAKLEDRQEAERRVRTLEAAEEVLLGSEGQIIRKMLSSEPIAESQIEMLVDSKTVARAIALVTSARGTKSQQREGTVLYRRATIFYRGVDYFSEELVHKKYEATLDRKRCAASQGNLVLFNWTCEAGSDSEEGKTDTYIHGPWVVDLVKFAAQFEGVAEE